jgi:hypothetical protein
MIRLARSAALLTALGVFGSPSAVLALIPVLPTGARGRLPDRTPRSEAKVVSQVRTPPASGRSASAWR